MNAKLRALTEALISEVNGSSGAKDVEPSTEEWWKQLDWESPDYQTLFDSLGKETQKLIIDAGLCPTYGEDLKMDEGEKTASEDIIDDCPDCEDDEEEIKRLAADLSLEDIDKKLKELKTARERLREQVRKLDEELYQEPDAEKKRKQKIRDERGELWDRLDDLYDEIRAYTQAKTVKITQVALADAEKPDNVEPAPPVETPIPFDVEASQKVTERTKAKIKELDL